MHVAKSETQVEGVLLALQTLLPTGGAAPAARPASFNSFAVSPPPSRCHCRCRVSPGDGPFTKAKEPSQRKRRLPTDCLGLFSDRSGRGTLPKRTPRERRCRARSSLLRLQKKRPRPQFLRRRANPRLLRTAALRLKSQGSMLAFRQRGFFPRLRRFLPKSSFRENCAVTSRPLCAAAP